ncbi:OLC1v1006126C4 [Oldenlandia corymbosa var. corymbosa]|uniref:OLC1v1006126C4 n=1 Tax=Oldenlandia corymbosa var. corymbosa TaxID=529605 RepID=A0AAV1DIQ6_OLDCO|nr:OLC1v1006126C4 [Oldenlandia corymbosa var. corymbosa]
MECQLELKRNLSSQEASVIISRQISVRPYRCTKLGDKFKLERNDSPSTGSHHKVVKGTENIPKKSKALHQRQPTSKEDELIRYMSNLPTYLERGEKVEEKAFNVGVLEWGRLEKWQDNHRHIPHRSAKTSPSNSNASSSSSTEGSSSSSGRGHSTSPARQRMHYFGSQPNTSSSPSKTFSRSIRSFEVSGRKFQDLAASSSNYVRVSQSILSTHKCFHKYTNNQSKESTNGQDPMCISKKRDSQTQNSPITSGSEEKMKLRDCESLEVKGKLLSPNHASAQSDDSDKPELLKQEDGLESWSPVTSEASVAVGHRQGTIEANPQRFSDISQYSACKMSSDIPLSCPFPREANNFMIEKPRSTPTKIIKSPDPPRYSGKFSASSSRDSSLEEKKSIQTFSRSTEALNLKLYPEEDSKVRHPSPIRRLVAKIGRNANTKDTSSLPLSSPDADKFRSRGAETDASSGDSSCEKSNVSGKGRSSPLRRLLDPLLKPRASSVDNSNSSPQRDAASVSIACQLSKGLEEPVTRQSVKVKLDLGSCKTINVDHPQDIGRCGPQMVQALFQVAVKNGLPLFTFAVDNSSDILAATMRKLGSAKKDGNRWMYTFFTVHEMKKKNGGWLHQGTKDRSLGYIPNVVAQMKVSDVASTDLSRPNSLDQCTTRECVLVATKNRGDEQISDQHVNDELAAIVLKLPKVPAKDFSEVDQKFCKVDDLSKGDRKCSSQEVFDVANGMQLKEGGSSGKNLNRFGLAVVLPDGDHGLPNEGEPSPLLQRWRSGSCDCGGWDLGCKLKVLAAQYGRASVPVATQFTTGKFQLYSQVFLWLGAYCTVFLM